MTPEQAIYLLKEHLKEAEEDQHIDVVEVVNIIEAAELPGRKTKKAK